MGTETGTGGEGCGREVWSMTIADANALLECCDCEVEVKRAVFQHLRQVTWSIVRVVEGTKNHVYIY